MEEGVDKAREKTKRGTTENRMTSNMEGSTI